MLEIALINTNYIISTVSCKDIKLFFCCCFVVKVLQRSLKVLYGHK